MHVLVRMKFLKRSLLPQLSSPLRQADEVGAKEEEEDDWFDVDRSSQLQNLLLHPSYRFRTLQFTIASLLQMCHYCVSECELET